MWIISKITPAVKLARPGLLCPAIAKNQGAPVAFPPFLHP